MAVAEGTVEEVNVYQRTRRPFLAPPRRPAVAPARALPSAPLSGVGRPTVSEQVVSATATVDGRGRCQLQRATEAMGWDQSTRLSVSLEEGGAVRVREADYGTARTFSLDGRGRLTVPRGVRQSASLAPGDGVLVVAHPDDGTVRLVTAQAVVALWNGTTDRERNEDHVG